MLFFYTSFQIGKFNLQFSFVGRFNSSVKTHPCAGIHTAISRPSSKPFNFYFPNRFSLHSNCYYKSRRVSTFCFIYFAIICHDLHPWMTCFVVMISVFVVVTSNKHRICTSCHPVQSWTEQGDRIFPFISLILV